MVALKSECGDLAEIDGVPIVVEGVELGEKVIVRLAARRNDRTDALDAVFDAALEAWAKVAVEHTSKGERPPRPPVQPGVVVFGELGVGLADDVGTAYRRVGGQVAGTGTEWDAIWRFEPAPPSAARKLRIAATNGSFCEFAL